jgi:beta-aspartyl-peptidase (threonine type)
MTAAQQQCLAEALRVGYDRLRRSESALAAVETAIRCLEGSGLFNAGTGSRLQLDGVRRMDAAIMEGHDLRAGAVAAIQRIRHPISAARLVMERTPHVLLVGPPATAFALHCKLERQRPPTTAERRRADRDAHGADHRELRALAQVVDRLGSVAAGASTGGIAVMLPGRVGDTPLIGSGLYADNEGGAVSMTGVGEGIIRFAVAKAIVERLAAGERPATAAGRVLAKLVARIHGSAGALVLSTDGRLGIRHTTPHMSAGYWHGEGKPVVRDRFP